VRATDIDEQLAAAILGYLSEFPNAAETPEGVTEWWLPRQEVRVQVEAVSRALEALVARGLLEEIEGPGQRRYRLKRQ
jgi:Fe2+ or Zn2+ uptake regulation protein